MDYVFNGGVGITVTFSICYWLREIESGTTLDRIMTLVLQALVG